MKRFGAIFLILLVVVLAYTVASVTLMNHMIDQDSTVFTILDLLRYALLSIFDMTDMDDVLKSCAVTQLRYANATNGTAESLVKTCTKRSSGALSALLTGKEVTVKLLLVQLVIPVFIKELDKYENLHERWRRKMYELVDDYLTKPPLVPPFIVLCHFALLLDWFVSLCSSSLRRTSLYRSMFFFLFGRNIDFKMAFSDADFDGPEPTHVLALDELQADADQTTADPVVPGDLKAFHSAMNKKYKQYVKNLVVQTDLLSKPRSNEDEAI